MLVLALPVVVAYMSLGSRAVCSALNDELSFAKDMQCLALPIPL